MALELFDWENRWKADVLPILDCPAVKDSLAWYKKKRGKNRHPLFKGKKPFLPYQCGREPDEGWQFLTKTDLAAYCPIGECHYIHAFCSSVGKLVYPDLYWTALGGGLHTVSVGCIKRDEGFPYFPWCGRVVVVSDILMTYAQEEWTAENSMAFAMFLRFCHRGLGDEFCRVTKEELDENYDGVIGDLHWRFMLGRNGYTQEVMYAIQQGDLTIY